MILIYANNANGRVDKNDIALCIKYIE